MSPKSMRRIEDLMERTEAASMAAVVRRAIEIYGACVDQSLGGGKVMLKDPSGFTWEFVLVEAQPDRNEEEEEGDETKGNR
jgi:hypothetical protein